MSQFPITTVQGVYDAINYLAAGPGSLGQSFAGFSDYTLAYLTGNFRTPFSNASTTYPAYYIAGNSNLTLANANAIRSNMTVTAYGINANVTTTSISSTTNNNETNYQVSVSQPCYDYSSNSFTATGNYNYVIFGPASAANLYVAPISCSSAQQLTANTFQYTFANIQSQPPFQPGNPVYGAGWTNSFYNGSWQPVGVLTCSTSNVVVKTSGNYSNIGNVSGNASSTISYDITQNGRVSTDCNGKVNVYGGTDRVFISAQLKNTINYQNIGATADTLYYTVQINRYLGIPNQDTANPGYKFLLDKTVAEQDYVFANLASGTGNISNVNTIFSTAIDTPGIGYWWYILEVAFNYNFNTESQISSNIKIANSQLTLRSLSAQVVKS
jgi:hypothetical protein